MSYVSIVVSHSWCGRIGRKPHPKRQGSTILGELEAHKAVDEETAIRGSYEAGVNCDKPLGVQQ